MNFARTIHKLTTLALLLICLNATIVTATTYYVSSIGSDSNTGLSITEAWSTIDKVNSINVRPGDKILFEGGHTFIGNIYLDYNDANDSTNIVTISTYGTGRATINASNSYGLYAYNTQGISISNIIFNGAGADTNTASGVSFYNDLAGDIKLKNVTIKSIEVKNFGQTGISVGSWNKNSGYKNVLIYNVHVHDIKGNGIVIWGYSAQTLVGWAHKNITVRSANVHNVTGYSSSTNEGSGIMMGQVDQGLIERCVAHDNGTGNTHCGGPGGIWVWDSNKVTLQRCESYRNSKGTGCDGFGFDFDGGVTNSIMQYNYSHNNDGAGFFLGQYSYARPWSNNVVRYNISENDARSNAGAISVFKGSNTTMSGLQIYNNTIYITPSALNTTAAAFIIKKWNTGINNVVVYDNIFQTTGGVSLITVPLGYSAYFAGNLYWSSGSTFKIRYQDVSYYNLANWQTATGNEKLNNMPTGMTADPLLTNVGYGGIIYPKKTELLNAYKLQATSPVINAGLNLATSFGMNSGTLDYFGNKAPNETAPDIGAYESYTTTTARADEQEENLIADEKVNTSISLFPNPVQGDSVVKVVINSQESGVHTVEIYSIEGLLVWKSNASNLQILSIPTNDFSRGVYMVRIIDDTGRSINSKLVVE
jgi:hypothetical protein